MLSMHGLRRRFLPIGATPDSVNQNKPSAPPTNQTSLMRRQIPRDTIAQHTPGRISGGEGSPHLIEMAKGRLPGSFKHSFKERGNQSLES